MSKASRLLCCIVGIVLSINALAQKPDPEYSFEYRGEQRPYWLHIPAGMKEGAPLVIVLHGASGNASDRGFDPISDEHGFALCYPLGSPFNGHHFWNVGYPNQSGMPYDDVDFLEKLINELHERFNVSKRNVFLTGHSNGGDMCYLVAEKKPELFAAYASGAGLFMDWLYKETTSEVPVAFMEIHGTLDATTSWYGDPENKYGWGKYLSVPFAVHWHVVRNKCTQVEEEKLPFRDGPYPIIAHRWSGGRDGKDVWLYEIVGGQHGFGNMAMMNEEIWKFFSKYIVEE